MLQCVFQQLVPQGHKLTMIVTLTFTKVNVNSVCIRYINILIPIIAPDLIFVHNGTFTTSILTNHPEIPGLSRDSTHDPGIQGFVKKCRN